MSDVCYAEKSWNPLASTVELTTLTLRAEGRRTALAHLNLVAMGEAFLRGQWVGGGGSERVLGDGPAGGGVVPVVRASGSVMLVKARRAREFAQALGQLAVAQSGGAEAVAALAAQAQHDGVPLWIARRQSSGPTGEMITVTVDRRLVRADVWGPGTPVIRLRGPYGMPARHRDAASMLTVTIGEQPATLSVTHSWRKSQRTVSLQSAQGHWELRRRNGRASRLLRNGQLVAELSRAQAADHRGRPLLPLADVWYESRDPLDALVAQFFAIAFALGDGTGSIRFGTRRPAPSPGEPIAWEQPWFTHIGGGSEDSGGGSDGADGWGDGGGNSDGGGGDGGGGDGGGDGGGGDGGGGGD
ncbi:hypothetical protein AAHZ94_01990 [Streptomyces sp. HSW2009]|uniref:hypothetical protein n=1 Tax=Streptomyces sp. HSW2009 TaxID=3142890 RepID=UPI0032EDB198